MTREECEQAICQKMKEIWNIYHEYNPVGYSLGLFANAEGLVMINNEYWKDDRNKPISKRMAWKED
jgi:hypothetical protein